MKGITFPSGNKFSDRELLKNLYSVKINAIKLWFSKEMLIGIQVFYQQNDGKIIIGKENILNLESLEEDSYTISNFQLEDFDYVKTIGGSINEKGCIDSLNFSSCKGKKVECGEKKEKSKAFALNISHYEVPICLYGYLATLNGN